VKVYEGVKVLSDVTNKIVEKLVFILLLTITIIILMEVVFRYFPILDVSWSEELAKMLAVWLALIGASAALREGFHIGLRFFVDLIPAGPKRNLINIFVNTIIFLFFIYLIVYGFIYTGHVAQQIAPGIQISMRWAYLAIPMGAIFLAIQSLRILMRDILHFSDNSKGE
jgi:TRAP-type C4-dicarboxylate transport system permease small subunit